MKRCKIAEISSFLPERIVTNAELEQRINRDRQWLPEGALEKLFGIQERRFAGPETQVSDLAVAAALPIVEKVGRDIIDLLLFAAACSDLIEPATSNIVQYKLGLTCPVMDIKNACNSFVSAIQTATAFIQAGMYQKVLIVNGEKLSDAINLEIRDAEHLKRSLAAFSLGDAGSAALISPAEGEEGIHFQQFMTSGQHWELCTIRGGGSMHPHDVSHNYFEGKTVDLKDAILSESAEFLQGCFAASGWALDDIDHLITHQVSSHTFRIISEALHIPLEKCISTFSHCGNTAAASIPLAIHFAEKKQLLKRGDKLAVIGLAAGISASVQLVSW